ncbi:MAG: branched-chain amino acid ABC transporter permease [Rubrivivax sp.]
MSRSPDAAPVFPIAMVGTFAVLASAPLWLHAVGLYPYLAVEIVIWMVFALAHNLLLGQGGMPSFGHGAYFGVGAYAFGLCQQRLGAELLGGMAGAALCAALVGAVVGCFISHRRGIYYALLTIAFGQVMWFVAIKWHTVTGGEDGLLKIARPPLRVAGLEWSLVDNTAFYGFVLAVFALVVVFLWRLVHSPWGRVLRAIKQNEMRASFVGYNVWLYKWSAFVLSAAISGIAGGLFAMAQNSAYPNVMSLHNSGFVVMMVLIGGGLVSFWGPVIGAAVFILTRDLLGAYTEAWLLWYGLVFMAVVLFQPDGIAGIWQAWRRRSAASAAARALRRQEA